MAASTRTPGLLWLINDSGRAFVLGLDASSGQVGRKIDVTGAEVDDWEDLGVGKCGAGTCLYIADIGDNHAGRSRITIYRVAEPDGASASSPAEAFHATYPDGAHDAEALLVTADEQLFVVTKEEPPGLYRFPAPLKSATTATLQLVRRLPGVVVNTRAADRERITGGAVSADGKWIALRSNNALLFYRAADFLAGPGTSPLRVDLTPLEEPQGEGVAFGEGSVVYLASEGGGGGVLTRLVCDLP